MNKSVQPITPMKIITNFPTGQRTRDSRFFKNNKFVVVDTFEINGKPKKVHIKVYDDVFDTKPAKDKWKTERVNGKR